MNRSLISIILVVLAVHLCAVAYCHAETYATFGLYADDLHTTQCAVADRLIPFPLYFYMFVSPAGDGVEALEMNIELSSSNISIYLDGGLEDIVESMQGSMPGDVSISFTECCESGWFHVFTILAEIFDELYPGYIAIGPVQHMSPPYPTVTDCTPGHEEWDVTVCYSAFINTPLCEAVMSNEESTWGAIKSMYR